MSIRSRIALFAALFLGMQTLVAEAWDAGLSAILIDRWTVAPCAWLARHLLGQADALAIGSRVVSPAASMNVLFGCDGSDVALLLVAAVLAAPLGWKPRVAGILAGLLFVFSVNQARLLALYCSLLAGGRWFGTLHEVVAPLAVVALVLSFFLALLAFGRPAPAPGPSL